MGSLIQHGRDESGQLYRRNRYYDPSSGRFTQEDPIGIAGGLNVYGFVGGDPIQYSDPYGLCCSGPVPRVSPSSPTGGSQGRQPGVLLPALAGAVAFFKNAGAAVLSVLPVTGDVNDAGAILTGYDALAGEEVGSGGRAMAGIGLVSPVGGGSAFREGGERPLRLIRRHVGDDGVAFLNDAGDLVVQSQDELREVRFDINRPHPHESPHAHVVEYRRVKNRKVEVRNDRVYPNDVPQH